MAFDKKPGLDIIVGLGKPHSAKPGMPPFPGPKAAPKGGGASPQADGDGGEPNADDALEATGQKASPEEAGVFQPGTSCGACQNYEHATQSCKVVDGQFTPDQGCAKYFEPLEGGGGVPGSMLPQGGEGMGGPSAGGEAPAAV